MSCPMRTWIVMGVLGLAACGGGNDRVVAPSAPPRLALADVVGVWAIGDDWHDAIAIADSGSFLWRATTAAGAACEVKGTAAILASPHEDELGYLEVKVEADTCRDLLPLRTWAIRGHDATTLTLVDGEVEGAAPRAYARQATP